MWWAKQGANDVTKNTIAQSVGRILIKLSLRNQTLEILADVVKD
jgi:hypothetical protein